MNTKVLHGNVQCSRMQVNADNKHTVTQKCLTAELNAVTDQSESRAV